MLLHTDANDDPDSSRSIERTLAVIPHTDAGAAPVINLGGSPPYFLTVNWTEVLGPDDQSHAVHLANTSNPITDADSANLVMLGLSCPRSLVAPGDTLSYRFDDAVIDPAAVIPFVPGSGLIAVTSYTFMWQVVDAGPVRTLLLQCTNGGGVAVPAPVGIFSELLRGLLFNNTSDSPGANSRDFKMSVTDSSGLNSITAETFITVTAVNDPPTLTAMTSPVVSAMEDVPKAITFQDLMTAGNEADLDGTVTSFVVKSVQAGTLMIVNSAGSLQPWGLNTNDRIDATHAAQWVAAPNANGLMNAFQVVAGDDLGAPSAMPVQVTVAVSPVNDAPVIALDFGAPDVFHTFTEVVGPDTGANAVHLVNNGQPITDADSTLFAKVQIEILKTAGIALPGDTISYRADDSVVEPAHIIAAGTPGTGTITTLDGTSFKWTIVDNGSTSLMLTFEGLGTGGLTVPTDADRFNTLLAGLFFNNTSDTPLTPDRWFYFSVFDDGGVQSASAFSLVNITPANDPPTLASFTGPVATTAEDTYASITFANLLAASNASDPDGTVQAFVVTSVPIGASLLIGESNGLGDWFPWNSGVWDTIDAAHPARWQAALNATGTFDAFAVIALDNSGAPSATPVEVQVNVTPVNDAPTFTALSGPVAGHENAAAAITLDSLLALGNEADIDGVVNRFVVSSVTVGTLRIGSSYVTSTPWSASSATVPGNDIIDATHIAYWTGPAGINGVVSAFAIKAMDNDGAVSTTGSVVVQADISLAPTLTSMAGPVSTVNEDAQTLITWRNLVIQGNEHAVPVDEIIPAFVVMEVLGGTLLIRNSVGSVAPWEPDVNDVIDAFHSGYWTADENANGVLDAVTVIAQDSVGARSATPVVAQVSVTAVNDRPTLTQIASPIATVAEDQSTFISASMLGAAANEADVDGSVNAYVVTGVTSGTLMIGTFTGSGASLAFVGTPWAPAINDVIDATRVAQWTPAPNANGVLNALRIVAVDDAGLQSLTPIGVQVAVTPVNDAPTLTAFSGPVDSTLPNTAVKVTMAEIAAKGNEDDIDGIVASWMVTAVPLATGTLRIGATPDTAELWAIGSNDIIDATHDAFWTPAPGLGGIQGAFNVVAVDNAGLASAVAVSVPITVIASSTASTGTAGADTLVGAAGGDTLRGLAGNDLLVGLAGDDLLDGGAGVDTLMGGEGSDLYLFLASDHMAAEVRDTGVAGIDEVRFATTTTSTLKLYAGDTGIERIVIGTGTGPVAVSTATVAAGINATLLPNAVWIQGNAGANNIVGSSYDDTIAGGAGADVMNGGNGNDTFYVDSIADKVVESASSGGMDTVYANVSFTLATNVEQLVLTGGALNGTGNTSANTITGNALANVLKGMDGADTLDGSDGNDTLIGGKGNDLLVGGAGADVFLFDSTASATTNVDMIADFTSGADLLEFKVSVFRALGAAGALTDAQFWSGPDVIKGHDTSDRVIYDTTTGTLYYDADGSGAVVPVAVAVIGDTTHPPLAAADFLIV